VWWENKFCRWRRGQLYLAGQSALKIAARFGTPLFVYSRDQIRHNLSYLRSVFAAEKSPELEVAYAMKANPNQEILRFLLGEGSWIDAVSPGEVKAALKAGFPAERIIFTGTSVSAEDLKEIMAHPQVIINIDALEQLWLMKRVAQRHFPGKKYRVAVRWNPGIGKGFNSKVTTAGVRAPNGLPIKFGVEASQVVEVFRQAVEAGFIPVGFHQHLGSGWTAPDWPVVQAAVEKMLTKAAELRKLGFNLEFLDFGGGIAPKYEAKQRPFPVDKYARFIVRRIKESRLPIKRIILEPGKFLVAEAGVLLLKVVYIKKSYGNYFVSVNAGTFNTLPRPAIYPEACHHIINCVERRGPRKRVTIAGHLCESGDVFAYDRLMPLPKPGDILVVFHAGAYGHSMASHFNLREIPSELVI
jgi:diaminopimelate decarboxylase